MHTRTRRLLIVGGVLAVVWLLGVVILAVFAFAPSSELLLALAGVGAVILVLGCLLGALVIQTTRSRERARGTQLGNLKRRLAGTVSQDDLAVVRGQGAEHEQRVDGVQSTVAALNAAITVDRSTLEEHGAAIDRLEQRIQSLEADALRIAAIEARLEATENISRTAPLESRLGKLEARIAASPSPEFMSRAATLVDGFVALAARQGLALTDVVTPSLAAYRVAAAVERAEVLAAIPYLDAYPSLVSDLSTAETRVLLRDLRRTGYLARAALVGDEIASRKQKSHDLEAAEIFGSELAFYEGRINIDHTLPALEGAREGDVVVHVVGKALPETQSGYTIRTQYTVEAQQRAGIRPVVVATSGSSKVPLDATRSYENAGVPYFELVGPVRGRAPWDVWLRTNVEALAAVVRKVRPAVLHAHSDFMNVLIAQPVARAYGIPLVNETRGFWEESWLSRAASAEGWGDLDELALTSGLPDMYLLRVEREAEARSASDAVVTLARVMEQHIQAVGDRMGLTVPQVRIASNAVDVDSFQVEEADAELRNSLGIAPTTRVVGYISSIVEYEGIDTLIRGVHALRDPDVRLLVVGDGPELASLHGLAAALGMSDVIFTGRVPHERVAQYYALMDVFVVPRKRAAVTELVTPLKPFEAMAAGLPCLFSDVGALAEIAEDSGAAALFRAGDPKDLARQLAALLADREGLHEMGERGAAWVREHRTWDINAATYADLYRSLGADLAATAGTEV